MPVVKIVDFNGQDAGEMELSNVVFDAPLHVPAMHQVVVAHLANCRQGTHSTKTRGEVSGGGKKPWKQKHTGRARQGSTRSPIWVHGGVAHGPKPRDYHQKVNKKVRRLAMKSALSVKVRDELMTVVRGMEMDKPSTKAMKGFMVRLWPREALPGSYFGLVRRLVEACPRLEVIKRSVYIEGARWALARAKVH